MTINIKKAQGELSLSSVGGSLQNSEDRVKQMLRDAIIAEYDAINKYEIMANLTENEGIKKILLDIAQEEKVHVGELESLLRTLDIEQTPSVIEGFKEVEKKSEESI
jgi:rubrerythrin